MKLINEKLYIEQTYRYSKDDDFTSLLAQMIQLGYKLQQNYKCYEDDKTIDFHATFIKELNVKLQEEDE